MKNLVMVFLFSTFTVPSIVGQQKPDVDFKKGDRKIDVLVDGKVFTAYIWPEILKKPVLWPVISSGGNTLTRSFPLAQKAGERVDHPHHVGIWFNFGDVNGLDFWNNTNKVSPEKAMNYGSIVHRSVDKLKSGKGSGQMEVSAEWVDHQNKVLLNEKTTFVFSAGPGRRTIDRITKLTAVNGEVKFTDNKEGMYAIRVTTELELPADGAVQLTDAHGNVTKVEKPDLSKVTGDYLSSEGITGGEVWGTRGRWMQLAGTIGGEKVAIVVIDHPGNAGYPTYWHARGYGLFAANTLGQKPLSNGRDELNFTLRKGETAVFKYRMVIASDNPTVETINGWASDWAKN